jgi:hypothetical protein
MRQLASEKVSQNEVAIILDRDPGTVAQAAIRYGIKFQAPPGPKPKLDEETKRRRRAEACKLYRQRKGAKPRVFRVNRFDDPRVMVQ